MGEWRFSIDEQRYELKRDQTMTLVGWYLSPDQKECDFCLTGDGGGQLPFSVTERFARPDVVSALGVEPGDFLPGFTIEIPNAPALAGQFSTLELKLLGDGEPVTIWSSSTKELNAFFKDSLIISWIDRAEILYDSMLEIQGWAIDQESDLQVSVTDAIKNPIKCRIQTGRRPDVVRARDLGEEFKRKEIGFKISAALEDIAEKKIYLEFRGATTSKSREIDIEQLKKEKKAQRKEALKKQGNFVQRLLGKGRNTEGYESYRLSHLPSGKDLRRQRRVRFEKEPKISITIPLYCTPLPFLKELLDSVTAQTYKNWQLCLADGSPDHAVSDFLKKNYGREKRIVYQRLAENAGISQNTNAAIALADGDYLMLCDHDDILEPDALFEIVKAINENDRADVLYTDEDKVSMDGSHYFDPNFKPDYNLFRLRDNNYICHIFVVKSELPGEVGGLRPEYDGAQDFDFILRCCEKAENVIHIPKALYHWRCHMNSTAADPSSKMYAYEAGKRAVEEHYRRLGMDACVEMSKHFGWYKSNVKIQGEPLISIIIPNKDHTDDLEKCLSSITEKSTWKNYEILVVENNSDQKETFDYYEEMLKKYPRAKLLTWEREFNYSAINNFAAKAAKGEYFLFLNNDTEVITPGWMEEMLMIAVQKDVGAVGAKLYYPDDTIQHAGVVIGLGGIAGHIFCGANRDETGYCGRLISVQEVSAVTAACVLVRAEDFRSVGGFDEGFAVAFNDIDLCMKLRTAGRKIVFTPYAELYHYESKSRGLEETPEKQVRFKDETDRFEKKWHDILEKGDPYYNPNLSRTEGDCSLRM